MSDKDAATVLREWAAVLQIPSGLFVNEDLVFAAAEIDRLHAELAFYIKKGTVSDDQISQLLVAAHRDAEKIARLKKAWEKALSDADADHRSPLAISSNHVPGWQRGRWDAIADVRAALAPPSTRGSVMPGTQCLNCRWWAGDREWALRSANTRDKIGDCMAIHPSIALPDDWPARLYPVGSNSRLSTRYDFSCALWEKVAALAPYSESK